MSASEGNRAITRRIIERRIGSHGIAGNPSQFSDETKTELREIAEKDLRNLREQSLQPETLFAQVEAMLGRPLTADERQRWVIAEFIDQRGAS